MIGLINNELLSHLLRFYGDHEIACSDYRDGDEFDVLTRLGLIEKSDFGHRITSVGFRVAGTAIESANELFKRMP